ncbi:hypothetical protein GE21DRAFT_1096731 [Neurospora crassa]|nr:hypothetical protein GE21DRAFT_1096731 [Neurospora crassa]
MDVFSFCSWISRNECIAYLFLIFLVDGTGWVVTKISIIKSLIVGFQFLLNTLLLQERLNEHQKHTEKTQGNDFTFSDDGRYKDIMITKKPMTSFTTSTSAVGFDLTWSPLQHLFQTEFRDLPMPMLIDP